MFLYGHLIVTALSLLQNGIDKNKLNDAMKIMAPKILLPDAIRKISQKREISHFSIENDGSVSWIKFPINDELKKLKELSNYHLSANAKPAVCSGDISISTFFNKNPHLFSKENYLWGTAIFIHFLQDEISNTFWNIDLCNLSMRHFDKVVYLLTNKVVDGKTYRKIQSDINLCIHNLWYTYSKEEYGVTLDKEWLNDIISTSLLQAYPKCIATSTNSLLKSNLKHEESIENVNGISDIMLVKQFEEKSMKFLQESILISSETLKLFKVNF